MNELQKEYFEKVEKEQAEAEAAEEARLKAVMEAERKKEAVKQEAEKKAKEEAERKAEAEAIEIINRVKAEMAANKKKEGSEAEDGKKDEAEKKEPEKTEPKQEDEKKEEPKQEESKQEESKKETPKADEEKTEETSEEEMNIYERQPVGEASMPKKSPKFKKGGKKSTAGKVPQRPQPQEAAVTEEPETAEAQPKESKEEVPDMKQKGSDKAKKEATQAKPETKQETKAETKEKAKEKPEAETPEQETAEKATPESKAAADREAKLQEVADEYQDKYKRLLAEFENARAREAKEASRMYDVGAKAVLEKLLPVVDNFERAIQTIPEEDKDRAFEQGVDKIYKQMMTILGDIGVEPMNAEGTEFNPDLHNAVMHVEDESLGENVVAEEMQKGYMYKDSVLRYSMVKVAN